MAHPLPACQDRDAARSTGPQATGPHATGPHGAGSRVPVRFADAGVLSFAELGFSRNVDRDTPSGSFEARTELLELGAVLAAASAGARAGGATRLAAARSEVVKTVISLLGFRMNGRLSAGKVRLWQGGPELTGLEADASVGPTGVHVTDITCGVYGGRAKGEFVLEYRGGILATSGEMTVEDVDLARIAAPGGARGALSGRARSAARWTGEGFTRGDLERNWEIEVDGRTGPLTVDPDLWPLAAEVRDAVELLLGSGPSLSAEALDRATTQPVDVRITMRRGRMGMESTQFGFDTGLRLSASGRAELDGRLAGWVTLDQLPAAKLPATQLPATKLPGDELPGDELPGDELAAANEMPGEAGTSRLRDRRSAGSRQPRPELAEERGRSRSGLRRAQSGRGAKVREDGGVPREQKELLSRLVERGQLRFGVTGTWAAPFADVRGLLWMLLDASPDVNGEPGLAPPGDGPGRRDVGGEIGGPGVGLDRGPAPGERAGEGEPQDVPGGGPERRPPDRPAERPADRPDGGAEREDGVDEDATE